MEKQIIESYLLEYLKKKNITVKKVGQVLQLECPYCHKQPISAIVPPRCNFINCFSCDNKKKTIFDLVRDLDKINGTEEDVIQYIKEYLNLNIITKKDKAYIEEILNFYSQNVFDLVAVAKDKKNPIELDWTNKEHRDIEEWKRWLKDGINIGIKTGKKSNLIVIDVDQKPVPQELIGLLGNTFTLETSKGFQYYYKYVSDLPKTRIQELKTDIETDGGQVVCYPSTVEGVQRKIINLTTPITMPKELHDYLKSKVTVPLKTNSEIIKEEIQTEDFNLGLLQEGNRNESLIKLGGIFRKKLNEIQTEEVLQVLNKHICPIPLSGKEIHAMVRSLSKYTQFDEQELAHKIMTYLRDVEEASRNEIAMAVAGTNKGEDKIRIDKALKYLTKEEYIQKKGTRYILLQKLDWSNSLLDTDNVIHFKMPYFYDIAHIEYGDLILIGSKTKYGKTHISMNIIKQLVEQGIAPYYVSLESGSRFKRIALQLGLKDNDFYYNRKWVDPLSVQLEERAIMVIDWLCPDNFAEVDKIFKHFTEQLCKSNGVLIVFMQLKEDGSWFSPNLVKQFPSLAVKYLYDNENEGTYGKFIIDAIREAKFNVKKWDIPCAYNWDSKELKRIDELEQPKIEPKPETPPNGDTKIDEENISN